MSDKLVFIRDLLKSCFLPELREDLDSLPIQEDDFSNYCQLLNEQLPILYDFVQQYKNWIFGSNEKEIQEIHACLIVLLCEVTASGAIYKLKREDLLKNANRILKEHNKMPEAINDIIFTHYQSKLQKSLWKRQLGAIHSFMRFLEFRYNDPTKKCFKMNYKWLTFCLSIGLTIRENHEPLYKQMGIRIFQCILHYASYDDIQQLNVHSVIYEDVFKDVHCMDTVVSTAEIWSCLYNCLEFFKNIDSFNWNSVDDMLEVLIRNISLTSDGLISICLMKFITKLNCFFAINRQEIEAKYNADLNVPSALAECRFVCADNTSYTIFRWAKTILNMFMVESHKLMHNVNICRQLLQEMHRCYMVCILPMPLEISEPILLVFLGKFTSVLMEVILMQGKDQTVLKLVKCILETFQLQLQHSSFCDESQKFSELHVAIQKLLKTQIFVA